MKKWGVFNILMVAVNLGFMWYVSLPEGFHIIAALQVLMAIVHVFLAVASFKTARFQDLSE